MIGDLIGLTDEQIKISNEWFKKHWKPDNRCPICGNQNFQVGTHIILPPTTGTGGSYAPSAPTYPFLPIFCMTCGYAFFFNAVVMGLWLPYPPPVLPVLPKPDVK